MNKEPHFLDLPPKALAKPTTNERPLSEAWARDVVLHPDDRDRVLFTAAEVRDARLLGAEQVNWNRKARAGHRATDEAIYGVLRPDGSHDDATGLLHDIRTYAGDDRYGADPLARKRTADRVANDIAALTGKERLSLGQALKLEGKRLKDMYDPDGVGSRHRAYLISQGKTSGEADRAVRELLEARDLKRIREARLKNPNTRTAEEIRIKRDSGRMGLTNAARKEAQDHEDSLEAAKEAAKEAARRAADPNLEAAWNNASSAFQTALGDYARILAHGRNRDLSLARTGARMGRRERRRAQEFDTDATAARAAYEVALRNFNAAHRDRYGRGADAEIELLEANVYARHQLVRRIGDERAQDAVNGSRAGRFIGRLWANNRFGRGVKYAVVGGAGFVFGGQAAAGVARAGHRYRTFDANYRESQIDNELTALGTVDAAAAVGAGATADRLDMTGVPEAVTTERMAANRRHVRYARNVGRIAGAATTIATGTFGGLEIAHLAAHHAATGLHHTGGAHHSVTSHSATTPRSGNDFPHAGLAHELHAGSSATGHNLAINPNQYPWQVAHGAAPGHEFAYMGQTNQFLAQHGVHANLVHNGNITYVEGATKGSLHQFNTWQQATYNRIGELSHTGHARAATRLAKQLARSLSLR